MLPCWEKNLLNVVQKWKRNTLNYQTDVKVYTQGVGKKSVSFIENCSSNNNSRCKSSVSRLKKGYLQVLSWPPYNQHTATTNAKTESAFNRKHNRASFSHPMNSRFTPLISRMAGAWSQWNARYKMPGSELSLNVRWVTVGQLQLEF
ncbi:uncharacterized protein TNCV_2545641 [Trichonephila clavipes]|nr:uncharacterized protein TNCV_2545641 [Trichonephila clavipes]